MNKKKTFTKDEVIVVKRGGKFYPNVLTGKWVKDQDGNRYPLFESTYWEDFGGSFDVFEEVKDGE